MNCSLAQEGYSTWGYETRVRTAHRIGDQGRSPDLLA